MTLPHDGFPRISTEGIRLLQQGLAGDFEGWEKIPANHPMELPRTELSNCSICADPETMHFIARAWHGIQYPRLDSHGMDVSVEFDEIDLKEGYNPTPDTINLTRSHKPWGWLTRVPLAVDDRGAGFKDTTLYEKIPEPDCIDDDEPEVFEVAACQRTLEGFRWPSRCPSWARGP